MSTFSGINTAFSGLAAARAGIEVTGQNVANVGVDGYTRQRVNAQTSTTIVSGLHSTTRFAAPGDGVSINSIERLGNALLDDRVRTALSATGFSAVRSGALSSLESALNEPSTEGLSAQLDKFWTSWSDLGNMPGDDSAGAGVIESATVLASQISTGYDAVSNQWLGLRRDLDDMVAHMNDTASRIAELNGQIQHAASTGANANGLIDQRNKLTEDLASLAGGTVNVLKDGTTEVLVGGNPIVSGANAKELTVSGGYEIGSSVTLEWAGRPGHTVSLDGGEIAGALTILAPAAEGGILDGAAKAYNDLATSLHSKVNALHSSGVTVDGAPGGDFFQLDPSTTPAKGLTVVPASGSDIAVAENGAGSLDSSIADRISQLGGDNDGPDALWSTFVTVTGVQARSIDQQAAISQTTLSSAKGAQASGAGVDLDEENVNLLMYQTAYQASARALTAIDEMLSILINSTGRVGL